MDNREFMDILKDVKKQAIDNVNVEREAGRANERFLYAVPYDSLPVTVPKSNSEVSLTLNDVIVVVKEKIIDNYGNTDMYFDIYDDELNKIGNSDSNHRLKLDREIMDDLIQQQIKAIEEAGMEVAGKDSIDEQGRLETYFEMIGRRLNVLNEKQEQEYKRALDEGKGDEYLDENSKNNLSPDENENVEKRLEDEQAKQRLQEDLGFEIEKAILIDDDLFFRNNSNVKAKYAYAVLTKSGSIEFVAESNGKYKKLDGFEQSSSQSGRANIIRNDETEIETKNTYGAIYPSNNKDMRYTFEIGGYGDPKLIEQRRNNGPISEESDKWLSREVQTSNTDYLDLNLEGDTRANISRHTFDIHSTNSDANQLGSGGISDKIKAIQGHIKEHGSGGLKMESLAQDIYQKANDATKRIEEVLKKESIELTSEDKDKIEDDVLKTIEESNTIYCDDKIEEYCNKFIADKEEKKNKKEHDEEPMERTERTLAGDALERRRRSMMGQN